MPILRGVRGGDSSVAANTPLPPPLSFRASGVMQVCRRYVSEDGNAETRDLVGGHSAARNLGQRQALCLTMATIHSMSLAPTYPYGEKKEPVYADTWVCTRRGFFRN